MIKRSGILLILLAFLVYGCKSKQPTVPSKPQTPEVVENKPEQEIETPEEIPSEKPEETPREEVVISKKEKKQTPLNIEEFRAAWIATVANINWPSKGGLSTYQQQQEAVKLLDFLQSHNFNAVIFQVRPQADALYESELEPWSYFLSGKQGKAPDPYYDPLEFWITEAHKRGLELHVWLNPYRAHHTTGGEITETSIIKKRPELAIELANGMWWLDPAKKETQDHSAAVVMDIVKRYDIDGVHFDDYFYPYDSYNDGKDFPDDKTFLAYQNSNGKLSRADWRRDNVNKFIKRIYDKIKAEKPFVKFGLSPFGIWRPGYPQSVVGYDQYDKLYADAKLWLNEGWIDYFTPQLYWQINQYGQSFPELLGWWESENTKDRHLWPGINVGMGGDEKNVDETINQIMITRGMLPESKGTVHWSIGPLMKSEMLAKGLLEGPYRKKALVPPSPWLDNNAPEVPQFNASIEKDRLLMNWEVNNPADISKYVLWFKYEQGNWDYKILDGNTTAFSLQNIVGEKKRSMEKIGITAVDRLGNQSDFKEIVLKN
ncbi:family 10 glycosylhydrolase [Gramella sp. MT6]|uniref:glycoside hydrolase family 10 protein n=1 Tax=Gramella sp. MT6 TaxID=2705471 RepID=UPI001C5FAC73|nr:family 10 glycosylhydrolase [Gramella sp. MT6]QYA24849.1 family 10 glycosylhydrolase [Gramella sp. MT6]